MNNLPKTEKELNDDQKNIYITTSNINKEFDQSLKTIKKLNNRIKKISDNLVSYNNSWQCTFDTFIESFVDIFTTNPFSYLKKSDLFMIPVIYICAKSISNMCSN